MTGSRERTVSVTGLSDAAVADIEAHVRGLLDGPSSYPAPRHGWTCFHCGETFRTYDGALLHFGPGDTQRERPVCQP